MNNSKEEFQRSLRFIATILLIAGVFILALKYSINRHFQPDEFALSKSIHLLNFPKELRDIVYIQFYMVPLSLVTNLLDSSKEILQFLRVFFLVLLLLSLFLMSHFSLKKKYFYGKVLTFLFLLTQYPLWRFGIEIRHEVIILFGLVCSSSFFITFLKDEFNNKLNLFLTGLSIGLISQTAYKGLIYSIGLSGVIFICLLLKDQFKIKRSLHSLLVYLSGYLVFSLLGLFILLVSGNFDDFSNVYQSMFNQSLYQRNFYPTEIFKDLFNTTPITLVLFFLCLFTQIRTFKFSKLKEHLPAIFAFGQVCFFSIILFMSPIPFRYNIIIYLASILIFIVHLIDFEWINKNKFSSLVLVAINLIVFILSASQDYYLKYTNKYQLDYIKTAEQLTSPNGRVIDGMGIVATRAPARKEWALYYAQMPKYAAGEFEFFSDAMLSKIPEVAITNYRWRWLRKEDHQVLSDRYVQIGKHMWVLGVKLKEQKGNFNIYKEGRYKIIKKPRQLPFKINGKEISKSIVYLDKGTFQFEVQGGSVSIMWLGEKATNIPYLFIHQQQPFIVPIQ